MRRASLTITFAAVFAAAGLLVWQAVLPRLLPRPAAPAIVAEQAPAAQGDSPIFAARELGQSPEREGDSPVFAARELGQSPGREGDSPVFAARKLGQSPALPPALPPSAVRRPPSTPTPAARAVIAGPAENTSQPGDLVVLRTAGSVAAAYRWCIVPTTAASRYVEIAERDNTGKVTGSTVVFASRTPGDYTFVLAVALGDEVDQAAYTLHNQESPPTPPTPTPPTPTPPNPTPPNPTPPPTPTPGPLLWITVVEDTNLNNRTPQQAAVYASKALRDAVAAGHLRWRLINANMRDAAGKVPAELAPYFVHVQGKTLPWMMFEDAAGNLLYEGPLPATADQVLALVQKYRSRLTSSENRATGLCPPPSALRPPPSAFRPPPPTVAAPPALILPAYPLCSPGGCVGGGFSPR